MLEGVDNATLAGSFKKQTIWIEADEVEVDEDEYLWDELTGFTVITSRGDLLGTVTGLAEFGAQDNLCVITPDDAHQTGQWMLPFIEDVIIDIDESEQVITIELLEGMEACFTPRS